MVDLDTAGVGLGYGVVLEYPTHVVEQPRHCQHHRGGSVLFLMVQEKLRVLVALFGGLCHPVDSFLLVMRHFLTGEVQLTQHVLGAMVAPLRCEDRRDIPVADFEDFVAEALLLPAMLQKTAPVLDLDMKEPRWELQTADELRRKDQKGHQSLREKYGKG